MIVLEPVPTTLPRHNAPLLLLLLLLLLLHQSRVCQITRLVYAFLLIKLTNHYLLHGHSFSKQLPINTPLTSGTSHILPFTRYTTTPSMNPMTAFITLQYYLNQRVSCKLHMATFLSFLLFQILPHISWPLFYLSLLWVPSPLYLFHHHHFRLKSIFSL